MLFIFFGCFGVLLLHIPSNGAIDMILSCNSCGSLWKWLNRDNTCSFSFSSCLFLFSIHLNEEKKNSLSLWINKQKGPMELIYSAIDALNPKPVLDYIYQKKKRRRRKKNRKYLSHRNDLNVCVVGVVALFSIGLLFSCGLCLSIVRLCWERIELNSKQLSHNTHTNKHSNRNVQLSKLTDLFIISLSVSRFVRIAFISNRLFIIFALLNSIVFVRGLRFNKCNNKHLTDVLFLSVSVSINTQHSFFATFVHSMKFRILFFFYCKNKAATMK